MNYDQLRATAQDGDIVFFHINKKDWMSRLTGLVTQSPFSHAAFLFWYKQRLMIVESTTHQGSRIVTMSTYSDREFELVPAPQPWSEIEDAALKQSGRATYGWLSAIYIGLREWMFTHAHIKLPPDKTNRNLACSEFVAETLGWTDPDISPGYLYDQLTTRGFVK